METGFLCDFEQVLVGERYISEPDTFVLTWTKEKDGRAEPHKKVFQNVDKLRNHLDRLFSAKSELISNVQLNAGFKFESILAGLQEFLGNKQFRKRGDGHNMKDKEIAIQAAIDAISSEGTGANRLQIEYGIGYVRAARIVDKLEEIGVLKHNKGNPIGMGFNVIVSQKELVEIIEKNF